MSQETPHIRLPLAAVVAIVIGLMLAMGVYYAEFRVAPADLLPSAAARQMQQSGHSADRVLIDVSIPGADPDRLVEVGDIVLQELKKTGLFRNDGLIGLPERFPELQAHVLENLPILLTRSDLETRVRPLLSPARIKARLVEGLNRLSGAAGMGREVALTRDPLGLSELVLDKLARYGPAGSTRIYKGHLISGDGRHLLITATPRQSSDDPAFARRLALRLSALATIVRIRFQQENIEVSLTPTGDYRSVLDNQMTAADDLRGLGFYTTAGAVLLLLAAFSHRRRMGLLTLLPALGGTVTAFFLFAWFSSSLSPLVMAFSGVVTLVAVVPMAASCLFLDRPWKAAIRDTLYETRAVALPATLAMVASLLLLSCSDIPLLSRIGLFAATAVTAAYLLLQFLFPLLIPRLQPVRKRRKPLLQRFTTAAIRFFGPVWVAAALIFGAAMSFFAWPDFDANPDSLNAVRPRSAENRDHFREVWGDVISRISLTLEAESLDAMQQKNDRLLNLLESDREDGQLAAVFTASLLYPGEGRARRNYEAWKTFWSRERVAALRRAIASVSPELGFAPNAFDAFFRQLIGPKPPTPEMPKSLAPLFGIHQNPGNAGWSQHLVLRPGAQYRSTEFQRRYSEEATLQGFSPGSISRELSELISTELFRMLILSTCGAVLLFAVLYLNWKLVLIALLPLLYTMAGSLGTLHLLDGSLHLTALLLPVVAFGIGIPVGLFSVFAYQRYGDETRLSTLLMMTAAWLAPVLVLIGAADLTTAEHPLLQSASRVLLVGIVHVIIGNLLILSPLLRWLFSLQRRRLIKRVQHSEKRSARVLAHYRFLEAWPLRMVRSRIQNDPMFPEIDRYVDFSGRILDLGCGYGAQTCWILDRFPGARIVSIDLDPVRVQIAARAMGSRGAALVARAPDLPLAEGSIDMALLLDMVHLLDDNRLRETLQTLRSRLAPQGKIIIRVKIPSDGKPVQPRLRMRRAPVIIRPESELRTLIESSGCRISAVDPSGDQGDHIWITAHSHHS